MTNLIEPYENLINAIIEQAVRDYEAVISDYPVTNYEGAPMTREELRLFAKDQWISDVKVEPILDKVEKVYKEEFRPYVREHWKEILEDWKALQEIGSYGEYQEALKNYPHRCPLCGGNLKPMNGFFDRKTRKTIRVPFIQCTYCDLNMRYEDGRKKKK